MDAETITEGLQSHHGIHLTVEQAEDYAWFFARRDNAEEILKAWKFTNGPKSRFPSLADLTKVDTELREAAWQREKKTSPTLQTLLATERTTHGKKAIEGIIRFTDGRMSRDEYLNWMEEMESERPGIGWAKAADDLRDWWTGEPERHKQGAVAMGRIEARREGRPELRQPKCRCSRCIVARESELPASHTREL